MSLLETYKAKLRDLYAREPARVNAAVVSAITWLVTAVTAVALSSTAVGAVGLAVGFLLPPLVAELTRPRVIPVAKIESRGKMHQGRIIGHPAERLTLEEALGDVSALPGEPDVPPPPRREEPRQTPPV